jgi:hypothetical protein
MMRLPPPTAPGSIQLALFFSLPISLSVKSRSTAAEQLAVRKAKAIFR